MKFQESLCNSLQISYRHHYQYLVNYRTSVCFIGLWSPLPSTFSQHPTLITVYTIVMFLLAITNALLLKYSKIFDDFQCVYVSVCVCLSVCVFVFVFLCVSVCVCVYVCICLSGSMCLCVCVILCLPLLLGPCKCVYVCVFACLCIQQ